MRLPEVARPHLLRLASDVQETVNVAILEGADVVYLLSETGDRLLAARVSVGMRLPAHCTALGKCLLAQLPAEVARARLAEEPYERRTGRTLTTWMELVADLGAIRDARAWRCPRRSTRWGWFRSPCPCSGSTGPARARSTSRCRPDGRRPRSASELTQGLLAAAREIDAAMSVPGARR